MLQQIEDGMMGSRQTETSTKKYSTVHRKGKRQGFANRQGMRREEIAEWTIWVRTFSTSSHG
jgi:hypothetical protein